MSRSIAMYRTEVQGRDHGVFIPMLLINPAANIPIVQLSVLSSNSPAQHFAMGQALASLRESGVAIVGSGMP
jgi:aromatic ring-opening dioxygenase catalytic subunit (LigB family)